MSKFKVGDRIRRVAFARRWAPIGYETSVLEGGWYLDNIGAKTYIQDDQWELVTSDSPVRTVTRREVVAGTYGPLEVGAVINTPDRVTVDLSLDASLTADEIDTLVQHLTAIAEALRAQ